VVIAGATISATATSIAAGNDNDNILIENKCSQIEVCCIFQGGSTTNPNTGYGNQEQYVLAYLGIWITDAIGKAAVVIAGRKMVYRLSVIPYSFMEWRL
jgi:hypothetical protein